MFTQTQIRTYLELTMEQARKTLEHGNYPIGSLIVNSEGTILTQDSNQCSTYHDVTAHAEMISIGNAGDRVFKHVNLNHFLFSSLEPCYGCSFFIARTNITTVYFALKDPHKGGISDLKLNPEFESYFSKIELSCEPFDDLREESRALMKQYFLNIGKLESARSYGYI